MISVATAIKIINESVKSLSDEKINVLLSVGRYLSENVRAKIDNPPFNMSAMDGFALKYSKIYTNKSIFNIKDEIFAGNFNSVDLKKYEVVKIYTGGEVPTNADSIIVQENAELLKNNNVRFKEGLKKNQYIRKKGKDFKKGQIILKKNHRINEKDLGLLIASNNKNVNVKRRPRVLLFSTGDEIVEQSKKLKDGQIYASSLYMLRELLIKTGCICKDIKILRDNFSSIDTAFRNINNIDLIITTGGVSVGKKDLIKEYLLNKGMKLKFWKVKVKPGKPILYGLLNNIPLFALPGNPVSSYVCFLIFVTVAINNFNKVSPKILEIKAKLENSINPFSERESYLRGIYRIEKNRFYVRVISDQDSSLMKNLSESNCLVKIKAQVKQIQKGKKVVILIYNEI